MGQPDAVNYVDVKDHAQKIVSFLAAAMKLSSDSLCFCGKGKLYGQCCEGASADEITLTEKEFNTALKYRDSQGGQIASLPVGIFNQFLQRGINRLTCLYPNCTKKPMSCHLIPENILRTTFGTHCLEYKPKDNAGKSDFTKTGIHNAGTMRVFCSLHDHSLFREIDTLNGNVSLKQQFLLAFKAIAFSVRRTQILLAFDSQVEIFRPILMIQSGMTSPGQHITINIDHLLRQYIRFRTAYTAFQKTMEAFEKENWGFFSYSHRNLPSSSRIFYAGFTNPSHDLHKKRINTPHTPVHITLNVYDHGDTLDVFLAAPSNGSSEAYAPLFAQLENADESTYVAAMNNMLTHHPDGLLLTTEFEITDGDKLKIARLAKHVEKCLDTSNDGVFELAKTRTSIQFISAMANEVKSHLLMGNKYLGSLLYFKDADGRGCLKLSFKNKIADLEKGTDVPTTLPVPAKLTDPVNLDISYKFADSLLEVKKIVNGKTEREFYKIPLPISNHLFMIRIKDWQALDNDKPKPNPLVLTPPSSTNSAVIIFSFLGENDLPFTAAGYHPAQGMGTINIPENPLHTFCIGLAEDPNNYESNGFVLMIPFPKAPDA